MATRIIGSADQERCRCRRRTVMIEALLDGKDIQILDIGQSGFGASGALEKHDCIVWPTTDNKAELDYTDFRGRQIEMLVEITNVDPETVRFDGNLPEVSGAAFDAIQDFLVRGTCAWSRSDALSAFLANRLAFAPGKPHRCPEDYGATQPGVCIRHLLKYCQPDQSTPDEA